jgi:DNA-binding IclR family transcriptional regulator
VDESPAKLSVDQFILEQIETVPHLEALLLVWNRRPKCWSVTDMANALFLPPGVTENVLQNLVQRGLLDEAAESTGQYHFASRSAEWNDFMGLLDRTYRRELIRVTKLIHSKAPSAVQEFARAFRLTKDKE